MSQQRHSNTSPWTPAWVATVTVAAMVVAVLAVRTKALPLAWWFFPCAALVGAVVTAAVTIAQGGGVRAHTHRAAGWLSAGGWMTWALLSGLRAVPVAVLAGVAAVFVALLPLCRPLPPEGQQSWDSTNSMDRRPTPVRRWEALLRRLTRQAVRVIGVEPWDNPQDGVRVRVELPPTGEITPDDLTGLCRKIATALRLPKGCSVRLLDGAHQGEVVFDVMLRDCLADSVTLEDDFTPASIYDEFTVMTTPRGESLKVCLRKQSMVIGGAPDMGKTTLLRRIMLFLARCTDALVWVADTNGGGLAEPFVRPWAMGLAPRPLVDWVAADEAEAAVMMAVAIAVVKDRKTAPEAVRRRHASDNTVLPVDAHLPAIVVINDEGGELRQAADLLGQLADQGISRLAQIGRAEAGRAIKSVLRGTADLMDKAMRVCASLRICLRMEEEDEYGHVLGSNPGRSEATLIHTGTGYLRRPSDPRPIHGRTVNVLLSQIERAAVACAGLRPGAIRNDEVGDLDTRGQQVAARVSVRDVLGGKDPRDFPDVANLPVMRDVAAGRAYSGRWERFAAQLAAMRGEELPEPAASAADGPPEAGRSTGASGARTETPAAGPAPVVPSGAIADLLNATRTVPVAAPIAADDTAAAPTRPVSGVDLDDAASVEAEARALLSGLEVKPLTTRELIVDILTGAYPEALTSEQIGAELERLTGKRGSRTHRQDLLRDMTEKGEITRLAEGPNLGRYQVRR